jgi:transposase-like protein
MSSQGAAFVPPHCPRSDCRFHRCALGWRWRRYGAFTRDCSPHRIPRFRCGHCGHTFSSQTFSTSYWLKRPDVFERTAHQLLACSGFRQIARKPRCSPSTVRRHAARLGRHALLWLWLHRPRGPVKEPVVVDGFEGFAYSQFHPLYLNFVVGSGSHYGYSFTLTELRRKGRMTIEQKQRRTEIECRYGRPDPRGIETGTRAALRLAVPEPQALVVRSDEHADYPRALRGLPEHRIRHERTSSLRARTSGNPLFPVNRLDLVLRHNSANHKRETIAYSRTLQSVVERAAWFLAWLNWTKPFSERHGGGTPAMRLGLVDRPVPIEELLRWRLFPSRVELPQPWEDYYWGRLRTRRYPREKGHHLKLAC